MHQTLEQSKTPTMAKEKSQVGNVVPRYTEIESMVAAQVTRPTEQLVTKAISTAVVDSLDDILQCKREKGRPEACSVVYNVDEQVPLDLSRQEVMDKIPEKHIANYFDTSAVADKIREKLLLSTETFTHQSPRSYNVRQATLITRNALPRK